MPPNFSVITSDIGLEYLLKHVAQLDTISPSGATATFRVFVGYKHLPYFQLQVEPSGQVTIPCVKLSDYGVYTGIGR